jgi:hypothetical protein
MTEEEIERDKTVTEHPQRYGGDTVYECIKVLSSWLSEEQYKGFLRGTIIKYLCRLGNKDNNVQELNKAKFYLDKLIEFEKGQNKPCDEEVKEFAKQVLGKEWVGEE